MPFLHEIELNGKTFEIYHFTGRVVSEKKWSETQVTGGGGGGGGYSHQGTGYSSTAPLSISSTTTRHDQFMLQNEEGKESSFSFANLNLACREGNILSVIWGIKKGKKEGPYWWVYNHNSEERFPTTAYSKVFEPPFWQKTLAFLSGLIVSSILGLEWYMYIVLSVSSVFVHRAFYYGPQGSVSVKKFKETEKFKKIIQLLDSESKKISNKSSQQDAIAVGASA